MGTLGRRDVRVSKPVQVRCSGNDGAHAGVTKDISLSGLFWITEKKWGSGDVVALEISHRAWEVSVQARVVHIRDDGVGFEFQNLSADTKEALRLIVDDLLAQGGWFEGGDVSKLRDQVRGAVVWALAGFEVESLLVDLSETGAFIETDDPPKVGAQVIVYMPGCPSVDASDDPKEAERGVVGCAAKVVRQTAEGFGVEFENASPQFGEAVKAFLATPRDA